MGSIQSAWVQISGYPSQGWSAVDSGVHCEQLESGKVLFFPTIPFDFPSADKEFLLSQRQADSRFHKNISYRPGNDRLKGVAAEEKDREKLHRVMRDFSAAVVRFVSEFLKPYAGSLGLDFASFRPLEEKGRDLSLHKRNDLLHVDAFPSRPTRGGRILRVFVNINPAEDRVWNVGQPFQIFLPSLKREDGIPEFRPDLRTRLNRWGSKLGLPLPDRSAYDHYMLALHDWLKENAEFQKASPRQQLRFPPGSTWMVYTDGVPHAVLSGQYALEQTFIVAPQALVAPEVAPFRVLERLLGRPMLAA